MKNKVKSPLKDFQVRYEFYNMPIVEEELIVYRTQVLNQKHERH